MSHVFPPHRLRTKQVAGVDDVNENVWEFVNEINGNLGEHNWSAPAVADRSRLALGAGCRVHHVYEAVAGYDQSSSPAGTVSLPRVPGWTPIDDMRVTFTGGPSLLWIIGSLQSSWTPLFPGGSAWSTGQAAIRLDGAILNNGIPGAVDIQLGESDEVMGGAGTVDEAPFTGAGLQQFYQPCVIESFVPVGPGLHTVELVGRVVSAGGGGVRRIYSRELVVVEFTL